MDPLSITVSCAAIAGIVKKLGGYAKDVFKEESERVEFSHCLGTVKLVTDNLKVWVEEEKNQPGQEWITKWDPKNTGSPLQGLENVLGEIDKLLGERETEFLKRTLKKLKWSLDKKQLGDYFRTIDRYCSNINSAFGFATVTISRSTNSLVLQDRKTNQKKEETRERKEVEQWLSKLDFPAEQQQIYENAGCPQSGQWFMELQEYKYWKEGRIKQLRCYGKGGVGKTVLSSVVINSLMNDQYDCPVICVYFDSGSKDSQTPKAVLGSLLKQLVQFKESSLTPAILEAYRKAYRRLVPPNDIELTELLKAEIESHSRVYIIVDGLDASSPESREFVNSEILHISPSKVSLLTMCRPIEERDHVTFCDVCDPKYEHPCVVYYRCQECLFDRDSKYFMCQKCKDDGRRSVEHRLHTFEKVWPESYEVTITTSNEDIENFARNSIAATMPKPASSTSVSSERRGVKEIGIQCYQKPTLLEAVVFSIVNSVDGSFLLATQRITQFMETTDLREIEEVMETLLSYHTNGNEEDVMDMNMEIFEGYRNDMEERIKGQPTRLAKLALRILSVVHYAHRNLTLHELQQTLAIHVGDKQYKGKDYEKSRETILQVTKGLITIEYDNSADSKGLIVRLFQPTLRDYFAEHGEEWFPNGRRDLANICLAFLSLESFSKRCDEDEFAAKEKLIPFISYAASHWGDHVREAGLEAADVRATTVKYLKNPKRVEAWAQAAWIVDSQHRDKWDVRTGRTVHPFHVCAWFDLGYLLPELEAEEAPDINVQEETYGQTPLMYACRRGNLTTIRQLLESKALVNTQSGRGRTALFEAILRLDIEHKQSPEIEKSLKAVELLLNHKIKGHQLDVNIQNFKLRNRTALITSISYELNEIALAILRHQNVLVNLEDVEGMTALCLAASKGMTDVVRSLLSLPSIDIDKPERAVNRSPLLLAAQYNHLEIVKMLLAQGAKTETKDKKGGTALLRAVEEGNEEVVNMLIASTRPKPDLSCKDEDGRGLMHWAAASGNTSIIKILIENGLEVNSRNRIGIIPLHDACRYGKLDAARLLLDNGADLTMKDEYDRSPFTIGWQYGRNELVELCKERGTISQVEAAKALRTQDLPIWSLAMLREVDIIKEVIASGKVNLDITEPETQNTAIHCALLDERQDLGTETIQNEILKELLQTGKISHEMPNQDGRTPLLLAAMFGNIEATQLLLEQEVGLNEVDRFEYSPLVVACQNNAYNVAVKLVGEGATAEQTRVDLEELLFAAIEFKNIRAVQFLLEAGADRMAQTENGKTVDMMANHASNGELFALIRAAKSFRFAQTTGAAREEMNGIIGNNGVIFNNEGGLLDGISSSSFNSHNVFRSVWIKQDDHQKGTQFPLIPHAPLQAEPQDADVELSADRFPRIPTTELQSRAVEEPLKVPQQVST
ncbi:ankyrin repeat-containing domain protein [Halenospora varia]|nr:ankyrin repeat-containing domain protein [Halenospora varia]